MRPAYGEEHMARVKRARGARRAGGGADAVCVEQEQQALALYAFKAEADVAGQAVYRVAVERRMRYL